ncbi:GroES-like protein [Thozetella sp. PMI_491]|nr:GroES-like protein [Thozetella sp. PMI_491]
MKAIVAQHKIAKRIFNLGFGKHLGQSCVIVDIPRPVISDLEILVGVKAVALNPTDYKHADGVSPRGSVVGCDFAGVVVEVGAKTTTQYKVGDRVAGAVHGGMYPDHGAFAEYLKADSDLVWRIPNDMSDHDAATYGVSAITAMLALNVRLGIQWPDDTLRSKQTPSVRGPEILIYSGATAAGLYAIQLAKAAGCTVIATASSRSFNLVHKYGADRVFDYRSATAVDEITKEFPNIGLALDCYSEGASTDFCGQVIKNHGGKVVTLLNQGKSKIEGVEYEMILAYTLYGRPFQWFAPIGPKFEAIPSDREALACFYSALPTLVDVLHPVPIYLIDGGFGGIIRGLDMLRKGEAAGGKFVVTISNGP